MARHSPDCVFCAILGGQVPGSVVYEDDRVVALMDISPVNPGHLFVIPREHAPYMADVDEETGGHLFRVAMRLAESLRASGLRCEGINLFLADGEAAFQEVPHVHLHVFPRFKGDAFKIDANWDTHPAREDLDAAAAAIREAYDRLYSHS
ncbi:MAG: HIT family protein [Thermoplasmata archaeon]